MHLKDITVLLLDKRTKYFGLFKFRVLSLDKTDLQALCFRERCQGQNLC